MTTSERFIAGINRYGYDSEFRKEVETIVDKNPVDKQALLKCFERYGI